MKTKTQKILVSFALLTSFSLIGCSEDAKEAIQNVADAPTLQGEFTNKCSSSMLLDASEQTSYKFEGNQFTRSQVFFSEDDCVNEAGRIEYVGDFTAEENYEDTATVGGDLNIEVTGAKIIPKTDGLATALNAINFCGVNNYESGKEVELTGVQTRGLCPIDNVPAKLYTTYRTDDINLYLADTDLGSMANVDLRRNDDIKYRQYYTDEEAVAAKEEENRLKAEAEQAVDEVQSETEQAADQARAEIDEAAQNIEEEAQEVERDTRDMGDRAAAETREAVNEAEAEIRSETDDE